MRLVLSGGAYETRGLMASAGRCENLFFEANPKSAAFPGTHYPASGLSVFADYTGVFTGNVRGIYSASNGALYVAIGTSLIRQTGPGQSYVLIGDIGPLGGNLPVSMVDNGTTLMVVNGEPNVGWTVDLFSDAFAAIDTTDGAFTGAHKVDFIDTYFVLNKMFTQAFYISGSNAATFDKIDAGEKIGYNDLLVTLVALHDNIWLLGASTTEVWFNSGAADFPFQRMPNSIIQYGCIGPWAAVVADNAVFWLAQDRHGRAIAMRGQGYEAKRISNFGVENEWGKYDSFVATMLMSYQQAGHEIVLFQFFGEDATWAYDTTTGEWHRRTTGPDRVAWPPYCIAHWGNFFDQAPTNRNLVIAGDHYAPRLLEISRSVTTDLGLPIERIRSWPHVVNDQKRTAHTQFVAAVQPGQLSPDEVTLRWSDDGGQTWGQPLVQTVNGATNGQYSWRRLGMARDRVYEISWTAEGETALNGAWIEAVGAAM